MTFTELSRNVKTKGPVSLQFHSMGLACITLEDRKHLQLSNDPSDDVRTTEDEEKGVADHTLRNALGLGFLARWGI